MKPSDTLPPLGVNVLIEVNGEWDIGHLSRFADGSMEFCTKTDDVSLESVTRWRGLPESEGDDRKWWAWAGDEWVQLASVNSPVVLEYYSRILRFCVKEPTSPPTAEEFARITARPKQENNP